jgi:hypothetical protein
MTLKIRYAAKRAIPVAAIIVLACTDRGGRSQDTVSAATPAGPQCSVAELRAPVDSVGARMRNVSLLAPEGSVKDEIRAQYAAFVTPALLNEWIAAPSSAPGREVSSPWPARISVDSVSAIDGGCRVHAGVEFATSTDSVSSTMPVSIDMVKQDRWRISAMSRLQSTSTSDATTSTDADSAVSIIRRYYAAIDERRFNDAYALWSDSGRASGKSLADFTAGFKETTHVKVETGSPSRVEPAAGSRYITIPVTITSQMKNGAAQRFTGTYDLRRSVVDGSTADQRAWRIASAEISQAQ